MITCIKITLTYARKRAKEGRRVNALFGEIDQSALKHGRRTFLKSAMGELVRSGKLWASATLRQLRSYKVGQREHFPAAVW